MECESEKNRIESYSLRYNPLSAHRQTSVKRGKVEYKGSNPSHARQIQEPLGSGGKHGNRKNYLQKEAGRRQEARNARTPQQQLALLDSRLGVRKGAYKERKRLRAMIEEKKAEKKTGKGEG